MGKKYDKWTKVRIELLKRLANDGHSSEKIGEMLGLPGALIRGVLKYYGIKLVSPKALSKRHNEEDFELFDEPKFRKQRVDIFKKFKGARRILTFFDMHVPFQDDDAIDWLMNNVDADVAVITEMFDFYGLSRFRKNKLISAQDDLVKGKKYAKKIKKKYKNVVLMSCNHDKRLMHLLQDRLADHTEVLEMLGMSDNPMTKVFKDIGIDATDSWWVILGKTIFCHPDWFIKTPMSTVRKSNMEYFREEEDMPEYDCIVNAHTHARGYIQEQRIHLFESGCLCKRMDYTRDGRMRLRTQRGAILLTHDKDGNFDFNKSRMYAF